LDIVLTGRDVRTHVVMSTLVKHAFRVQAFAWNGRPDLLSRLFGTTVHVLLHVNSVQVNSCVFDRKDCIVEADCLIDNEEVLRGKVVDGVLPGVGSI
jgi:hypothetical protein